MHFLGGFTTKFGVSRQDIVLHWCVGFCQCEPATRWVDINLFFYIITYNSDGQETHLQSELGQWAHDTQLRVLLGLAS